MFEAKKISKKLKKKTQSFNSGNSKFVQHRIENRANVNIINMKFFFPLHSIAIFGNLCNFFRVKYFSFFLAFMRVFNN